MRVRTIAVVPRLLFPLMLALLAGSCNLKSKEVYEIPDGYRGWVLIQMKRSWSPPLPKGPDGSLIFRIGRDGSLCTSSETDKRWGQHEYYYVSGKRVRQLSDDDEAESMVWAGAYIGGDGRKADDRTDPHGDRHVFFVGTKAEYAARKELDLGR
jgi:hypothetical protein